ncbi:hypothetical protein J0H58_28835 [bacterium]|nr:hypothetical protein [bacterium]
MSLRDELTTKYGPLPGWAWLAGVFGFCTFGLVAFTVGAIVIVDRLKPVVAETTPGPQPARSATAEPTPVAPPPASKLEPIELRKVTEAYFNNPTDADGKYRGKRVAVSFKILKTGDAWVGVRAAIKQNPPRFTSVQQAQRDAQLAALQADVPNVILHVGSAPGVREGQLVVVEATCDGMTPDPRLGWKLTFSNGRVVPQ